VSSGTLDAVPPARSPAARRVFRADAASRAGGRRRALIGTVVVVVAVGAWYLLTTVTGAISPGRFPGPADVARAARQIILPPGYSGGTLAYHVLQSCRLVLLGFVVAASSGVLLGLLMGMSRRAEATINPVFLLLRPIPPLGWIPLAILWLGLGDTAKIFVIWVAAVVPSVINTFTGVRNIDPTLIEAARMMGARGTRMLTDVTLPGALPMIFTGLRLSLQVSWTTLVAAELVGAFAGLGKVLSSAALDINPGMIFFAMVCVGLLGWGMTRALEFAERKVLAWQS
jgi:NitT/TauT family transport system permease protein/taurine transport system permease protein